jgi:hypothetical protein
MRVRVGAVSLFFEVLGQEWVLEEDGLRRRPVLLGLHGGPGHDATVLRHRLAPIAAVAHSSAQARAFRAWRRSSVASEELAAAIPNGLATLELVEGAAHSVFHDNPKQVYRCLRDFVADFGIR